VTILNASLDWTFDLLLSPFRQLPPIVGLSVVSLLTAAGMLLVFRATSDQRRLADVKRGIVAALFEIRLFNDDLPALFRAQAEILKQNAVYLRLSLAPMLWMMVPIALVVVQLEFHYGYAGLTPGEPVLVKAQLRHAAAAATLDVPREVRVSTPAVWFPATNEMMWRVTPEVAGEYVLRARIDGGTFTKTLDVTDRIVRRSPVRTAPGLLSQLMYPAERPLPDGAEVTAISVRYPSRTIRILGWELPWLVVYFGFSMAFALVLRKPLDVTL